MDALIFILTLVACGVAVASAVISASFARKNNVRELQNDVEEIAIVVDKVARESKRQQMQRVRAAAEVPDFPKPPGVVDGPTTAGPLTKAQLRAMVNRGNPQ